MRWQLLPILVIAAIALVVAEGEPPRSEGSEPATADTCNVECELLLKLAGVLEGGQSMLNWSAELPMTSWTGVTIQGGWVTKLDLAGSGLEGQVSGLIVKLRRLEELRLNDNALKGILPSKLWQLTNLTHVYLGGNEFTGCVPPNLTMVPNNDVAELGLPDCAAVTDVNFGYWERPLAPGTYMFSGGSPLIFDVPVGVRVMLAGGFIGHDEDYRETLGLVLQVVGGDSDLCLEWILVVECGRRISATADDAVGTTFDLISASLWRGRQAPQPSLNVISDGAADALILEWTIARSRGVSKWQYRNRETRVEEQPQAWSAWTDVPGSDSETRAYRVTGLKEGTGYTFELRALVRVVPGESSYSAWNSTGHNDGRIRSLTLFQTVVGDGKQQWRPEGLRYVVVIPAGMRVYDFGLAEVRLTDACTGSSININRDTGKERGREIIPRPGCYSPEPRCYSPTGACSVDELFDEIMDSLQPVRDREPPPDPEARSHVPGATVTLTATPKRGLGGQPHIAVTPEMVR